MINISIRLIIREFMKNLYIDFDGVIMDTIGVTYDMLDRLEVDRNSGIGSLID